MIREDYILSWIKRFVRLLAEIAGLLKVDQYQAATQRIDLALRELLGLGADSLVSLTEGEIMARLILGDSTQLVRERCIVLAALLNHLGIACAGQDRLGESQECWVKSLHIMLGILLREEDTPLPEYAPKMAELVERLKAGQLSFRTYATLMVYYEQTSQFAKAEDALFAMLDTEPGNASVKEMGTGFYQRLLKLDDVELTAGNLPRSEVEAGLAELQ